MIITLAEMKIISFLFGYQNGTDWEYSDQDHHYDVEEVQKMFRNMIFPFPEYIEEIKLTNSMGRKIDIPSYQKGSFTNLFLNEYDVNKDFRKEHHDKKWFTDIISEEKLTTNEAIHKYYTDENRKLLNFESITWPRAFLFIIDRKFINEISQEIISKELVSEFKNEGYILKTDWIIDKSLRSYWFIKNPSDFRDGYLLYDINGNIEIFLEPFFNTSKPLTIKSTSAQRNWSNKTVKEYVFQQSNDRYEV